MRRNDSIAVVSAEAGQTGSGGPSVPPRANDSPPVDLVSSLQNKDSNGTHPKGSGHINETMHACLFPGILRKRIKREDVEVESVKLRAGGRSCVTLMHCLYLLLRAAMRMTVNLVAGNNGDL